MSERTSAERAVKAARQMEKETQRMLAETQQMLDEDRADLEEAQTPPEGEPGLDTLPKGGNS